MRMSSKNFRLQKFENGLITLSVKTKSSLSTIVLRNQKVLDELFKFLAPFQEGQEVVWMRRPQGPAGADNSWYPCHRNDPGAVMFVGPPGA